VTIHLPEAVNAFRSFDYLPDFIVRLRTDPVIHLFVETKGYDELAEVKAAAAERWVAAVNADGQHGTWKYGLARSVAQVRAILDNAAGRP
jgi:type III restriction enzyme